MKDIINRTLARIKENRTDLGAWKSAQKVSVETGYNSGEFNDVSLFMLKRGLGVDEFTSLFSDWLNGGGKGFGSGLAVGLRLRQDHRTLQGLAVEFCVGVLAGLAQQEYTDARNETAVETAKKIVDLFEDGTLGHQRFI